jgi:preprotein translocase subunit SecA
MVRAAEPLDPGRVRTRLHRQGLSPDTLADALALAGQAARAALGFEPRPAQWRSAAALLDQRLVEMDTGEGKTLAAAMAAAAAALAGTPVHVLTANDYLAGRDAGAMKALFGHLGLSVASSLEHADESTRRLAYAADVCYATARTVAFDYLRDLADAPPNGAARAARPRLRGLCMAIIDEADSVLIDEARMPLVLAVPRPDPGYRARLWQSLDIARRLGPDGFEIDAASGAIAWQAEGLDAVERLRTRYAQVWINRHHREECVLLALRALHGLRRDHDYVVHDGRVVLVDENTGRPAASRQLPGDLHGLVALKEGLTPPPPSEPGSGLTYPRFFARYHLLSGLSGTLAEARTELRRHYGLRVQRVERDLPNRRRDEGPRWFECAADRTRAVIARARELSTAGRPVLIGVDTVADAGRLARTLAAAGLSAQRIDAGDEGSEAGTIAGAGTPGRITIATPMAGRGTDIVLSPKALAAGGLHVLNLQLNRSRRVDRQMVGRAARQGEPGSSEHWLCGEAPALQPSAWPSALGPVVGLLRRFGRAGWLLRLGQRLWNAEDRLARSLSLSSDRAGSIDLHFTSMGRR